MRGLFGVLGDIHANWEALCAVLDDATAQGVSQFVCVGDVVGYNASPSECLQKVREIQAVCVRGNHDHFCSRNEDLKHFHPLAARVVDWTREHLTEDQKTWLQGLRFWRHVDCFTVVHATLDMPEKWGYVFDELDARANFTYQTTSVCFHGHTHVPAVFESSGAVRTRLQERVQITFGKKYFVNVGSVGQPRNGDPRACYAIFDPEKSEVIFRRVTYDVGSAQGRIQAAGLPEWNAERLAIGK